MRKLLTAVLMGIAVAAPLAGLAAPDEVQKQIIQRAQDAKRKLAAAQAATGEQRQMMMQEMMKQMQAAKPREGMTPQQMREWMDEHMKLMDQMMGQMTDEQKMMMRGPGK